MTEENFPLDEIDQRLLRQTGKADQQAAKIITRLERLRGKPEMKPTQEH